MLPEYARASKAANSTKKHCVGDCQIDGHSESSMSVVMQMITEEHTECVKEGKCPTAMPPVNKVTPCENSYSGEYQCANIDMQSFVPLKDMGTNLDANDIWGWTDSNGREIAIVGLEDGTAFVDVTKSDEPMVLGNIPTRTKSSLWRDIKVYKDHAFIVSEASDHGMQVYDLTQLAEFYDKPAQKTRILKENAWYGEVGNVHNIVINEDSGFAYLVGSRTCRSGLHAVDISEPKDPTFAGCFSDDGYTHDAQCVNYDGPDKKYAGAEICFNYNEDTLTIVDVSDKDSMKMIGRIDYDNVFYTHQGWLTADSSHLLLDDELDESRGPNKHTRTMLWNVEDLENPKLVRSFFSEETAIDHNQYIVGDYSFQSNYCAGLRVLRVEPKTFELTEVAYFDIDPTCDSPIFQGSWSNYPYFASGNVIVTSIERGLFVLKPALKGFPSA